MLNSSGGLIMLTKIDKDAIRKTASKYCANRVFFFDTNTKAASSEKNDNIDLAVEGIDPKQFFKFYGDLMFQVSKPIDIIDMSHANKYSHTTSEQGVVIYDKFSSENRS
jgi:hypothetical protein